MDERFVKKLLLPSFIIVVLSSGFFYELKYLIDVLFFKKKHILIIGILSAPENFQQRLSIRETWLQLLSEISGASYFIIGNEICEVPPLDRVDPYSCLEKPYVLPPHATTETEFTTIEIHREDFTKSNQIPGYIGFGFYIRNSITVMKLGVLKELLKVLNREVQVKLVSSFDSTVLASVTFNPELMNETTSEVVVKSIKPLFLPKSFEGLVKLEASNLNTVYLPNCKFVTWQKEPNVINFIHLWQEDNLVVPLPFTDKSCPFVFFNYSIIDIQSIKENIINRPLRQREWMKFNKKLSIQLKNESKTYNDLVFLEVADVYRNLSMKMVQFFKRIVETEYFHYVLKTDDDSFIDLLRVHDQLKAINKEIDSEISQTIGQFKETGIIAKLRLSKFWWWSSFRELWKVQRSGKWRDDYYRSVAYPTFPCGGGYVVNKGVVDYIASNQHNLNYFQGEDVSLGIWLSSLPVTQYRIPRIISDNTSYKTQKAIIKKFKGKKYWIKFRINKTLDDMASNLCEWTCSNKKNYNLPFCNKVQLNVQQMFDTWAEYTNKGFI